MFSFVIVEFLLHVWEELPSFPAWTTRHFGTTTFDWYIISHLILFPPAIYILLKAQRERTNTFWVSLGATIQTILFTNGIFHLVTTVLFREYSPGVASSVLITFPYSIYFYKKLIEQELLDQGDALRALLLGILLSILIILSLFLDISFSLTN